MDEEFKGEPAGKKRQSFRLGDTVRIVSGPFVSFIDLIRIDFYQVLFRDFVCLPLSQFHTITTVLFSCFCGFLF